MYSISLFVTALCMVFVYRAQHPELIIYRAGLNRDNPETWRNPVMRFGARVRLVMGMLIMLLVVSGSYQLPIEIGQIITTAQARQVQQQNERVTYRLSAEKRHAEEMMEALGGADAYLSYLARRADRQFTQK